MIGELKTDLQAYAGKAEAVVNFSADLWQPYRDGIKEHFENARLTIDRHHVSNCSTASSMKSADRNSAASPASRRPDTSG